MKRLFVVLVFFPSCLHMRNPDNPGAFDYDLKFLRQHDTGLVVLGHGAVQVIVSPKYQGKVFTSTDSGRGRAARVSSGSIIRRLTGRSMRI
jgi:hypothetical protein